MIKGEKQRSQVIDLWDKQLSTISEDIIFFFDLQMCNYENNSPFLCPILPAHSAAEMHMITPRAQLSKIASRRKNMAGTAGKGRSCYIGGLDSQASLKRVKEEAG